MEDYSAPRLHGSQCAVPLTGFVIHKRVMGELAITRALGDADFKDTYQLVIATPEIQKVTASRSVRLSHRCLLLL